MFYGTEYCILTYFEAKPDALDPERLQGSYVTTFGGCNHTSYNEPAAGAAFFLQHVQEMPQGFDVLTRGTYN